MALHEHQSRPTHEQEEPAGTKATWFTTTHWSVVLAAGQGESPQASEALEKLCRTYWYPLYAYVRRGGKAPADAEDLVQDFLIRLVDRRYLARIERRGKFRSFLLVGINRFLADERDRARTAKRGGGQSILPLEGADAESRYAQELSKDAAPDKLFDRQWAFTLLEQALRRLEQECVAAGKGRQFELLKDFLVGESKEGDYNGVASELEMTPQAVAVAVHRLRQRYREAVRVEVAQTVSSPSEVEEEMQELFAALR